MIGIILIQKNFRIIDNPIIHQIEKYKKVIFIYSLEKDISLKILSFKLEGFLDLMNQLKIYHINGYVYQKDDIQEELKKVIKEDFQIINDNAKTFLFPSLTKEYKIFRPFLNYHIKNNIVTIEKNTKIEQKEIYEIKNQNFILIQKFHILKNEYFLAGETEALKRWHYFKKNILIQYEEKRDFLDNQYTSILSPYINTGQISVRLIWQETINEIGITKAYKFLSELVWRDFAYHIYQYHPTMTWQNINKKVKIDYENNTNFFNHWKNGTTGFPIIDAGMKQLKITGWIPNRTRMIVASFLTKNLLIEWQKGAHYFLETLIDADPIINAMNWQWIAGTGIDHAPYFRIFNPQLQAKKYDPYNLYQNRWNSSINQKEIIDLQKSRQKAMEAYQKYNK